MRLPYVPEDPQLPDPDDQAVVERVKARRGGKLIALDRALLHAPPIADGWNAFLKAIRTQNSLPDSIRELAICRVAVLNKAWFEWENHAPLLEATGVVAPGAVQLLRTKPANEAVGEDEGFDEPHAAVLEYVDAMTIGCIVPNAVFERTRKCFSEREVTELTATVSAYACVSRFLVALDVGEMAQKYGVDMD